MRRTHVIASVTLATVIVALLGMRVITTDVAGEARSAFPSVSIDILQMMRDARDLQAEQYDTI
jgi:hypothetical protein